MIGESWGKSASLRVHRGACARVVGTRLGCNHRKFNSFSVFWRAPRGGTGGGHTLREINLGSPRCIC